MTPGPRSTFDIFQHSIFSVRTTFAYEDAVHSSRSSFEEASSAVHLHHERKSHPNLDSAPHEHSHPKYPSPNTSRFDIDQHLHLLLALPISHHPHWSSTHHYHHPHSNTLDSGRHRHQER